MTAPLSPEPYLGPVTGQFDAATAEAVREHEWRSATAERQAAGAVTEAFPRVAAGEYR